MADLTAPKQPIRLRLPKDVLQDTQTYLYEASIDARAGVEVRDDDLKFYAELLNMRGASSLRGPWPDSCRLEDPLIREQHTQLHSKFSPSLQRGALVMVDAVDPADADSAKRVEAWLAYKNAEEDFAARYGGFLANGLRDPAAILACRWQQEYRQEREVLYWDGETVDPTGQPLLIPEEAKQEGVEYSEVPTVSESVESQKAVYEVIDLADFYLYPADRQSLQHAQGVFVRQWMSESQLLDGIDEYGYDEKAVLDLIRLGPTVSSGVESSTLKSIDVGSGFPDTPTAIGAMEWRDRIGNDVSGSLSNRERQERAEGIAGGMRRSEDGLYECFEYWGYLPKLRDERGEARLPEYLFRDRVRALICPARKITILLDFAPYQGLPFFHTSMLPTENRFLGMGLVQLLMDGGLAATFMLRYTLNDVEIKMQPPRVGSDEDYAENGAFSVYPNAKLIESSPGSLRFMEMPQNSQLGFESVSFVLNRFKALAAAEGVGELQPKVRKNAEMQNVLQTADSKYGLYGYNLFSPLPLIAAWRLQLELQFNPTFSETFQSSTGQMQVTADDLRKKFRFSAIPISADNEQTRAARTSAKIAIQMTFFQAVQQFPQWASEIWHGARQALLDLNERNPVSYIGDEQKMAMMAQAAMQQMAMQLAQQTAMNAMGSGGAVNGAMNGNGAAPPMERAA